ncbi:O-antigen ligase family protein [Porphyrobacter sp. AAP82]|uniref:O-antigen ligase family protein n=1 Tax=Porphyrobacter sp. AAP82 TaxID=1248917 RepID=UPI0002DCB003|nr:hypothetical protein [Porphyrobacter sp. AAP82]
MATTFRPAPIGSPLARRGQAGSDNVPIYLAVALGYMLLLPPQLNLMIGTTALPPYRFMLIPAALYMISRGLRGQIRLGWIDALIVAATAWLWLALFMTTEAAEAFTAAFAQTTDIALAYFFGRFTIRSLRDLRAFLIMMAPGLAIIGLALIAESLTHKRLIQDFAGLVTGRSAGYRIDVRLGVFRAPGPFPHPILAGVFLASFLPLYVLCGVRGWPKVAGIVAAVFSFFTLSSAALLGLVVGGALLAYNWLSAHFAILTWRLLFVVTGIVVFVAETATGSGTYGIILRFASMNSVSSYHRVLIWQYGTQNVLKNPWFGLGYGDWERPVWMYSSSMDHFWLLMAVRFGIIPSVLMAIATIWAVLMLMRAATASPNYIDRRAYKGLAISLGVFGLSIISVALWLSAHIWFFMLIGLSVSVSGAVLNAPRHAVPVGPRRQLAQPIERRPELRGNR